MKVKHRSEHLEALLPPILVRWVNYLTQIGASLVLDQSRLVFSTPPVRRLRRDSATTGPATVEIPPSSPMYRTAI
ncbi:hypothetical protein A605_14297 (plasmid) [Corynebacterium halotolerans YIM 70093 = DSM 44683]|uniref:Uncharacterized protein n=1 Tax=Corynebacterium halotolerans YIM 70093 = DSM 44683 TaxID=1121362 RepID=M1PAY1_9CORY|nr:hypothetical protein A605_14297 [Corynebacterium halotolerans YIM 70093 = DSM 44683]